MTCNNPHVWRPAGFCRFTSSNVSLSLFGRCLTGFGVDVGPQNVPTGNVLQPKSFGDARRHRSLPRAGRSHYDSTKNLMQGHFCATTCSRRAFQERTGRVLPMKTPLWMRGRDLDRRRSLFSQGGVRSAAKSGRVLRGRPHWTLTFIPAIPLGAAETQGRAEGRGGGGRRWEVPPVQCQRGQMGTHSSEDALRAKRAPFTARWLTSSPMSPLFAVNWRCIYCIIRLCNWSTGGKKLVGEVAVINPFRALDPSQPADLQSGRQGWTTSSLLSWSAFENVFKELNHDCRHCWSI